MYSVKLHLRTNLHYDSNLIMTSIFMVKDTTLNNPIIVLSHAVCTRKWKTSVNCSFFLSESVVYYLSRCVNSYFILSFLIVCFTSYFVFSIAVLPHSPGVVYYHLLLRQETRIPRVALFSFQIGIWDLFVHRGQKSYTSTPFGKLWTTPRVRCMKHASS